MKRLRFGLFMVFIATVAVGCLLTSAPSARAASQHTVAKGKATYYAACSSCAAAGPALRKALGSHWRGKWVEIHRGGQYVTVKLTDRCACGPRDGVPTIIDLPEDAFYLLLTPEEQKAGISAKGVMTVRAVFPTRALPLPPTDTLERIEGKERASLGLPVAVVASVFVLGAAYGYWRFRPLRR